MRVLIVDDEEDMRVLVRSTIEVADDGLSVAGEAADGEEAIGKWRAERPEAIVLDQQMPGATGLETAERILAEQPGQSIILFTAFPDRSLSTAAARLGVSACVSKRDLRRLPDIIRAVADCA